MDSVGIFQLTVLVLIFSVATVAIGGNLVVLFVFCRYKDTRKKRTFLLLNQAIADLFMSIGIIISSGGGQLPLVLIGEQFQETLTKKYCLSMALVFGVSMFFGQVNLLILAAERCYATIAPLRYHVMPKSLFFKVSLYIGVAYASLTYGLSYYFVDDLNARPVDCGVGNTVSPWYARYYTISSFFISVFTLCLYGYSLVALKRKIGAENTNEAVRHQLHTELKTQKTCRVIMLTYALGWVVPLLTVALLQARGVAKWSVILFPLGAEINAAANFFIYMWKHEELKAAFKKIISKNNDTVHVAWA